MEKLVGLAKEERRLRWSIANLTVMGDFWEALLAGVIVWAFGSVFLSLVFDYIPFLDVCISMGRTVVRISPLKDGPSIGPFDS